MKYNARRSPVEIYDYNYALSISKDSDTRECAASGL